MKNKRAKLKFVYKGAIIIAVIMALILAIFFASERNRVPDGAMEVHFVDVGQGDCILFRTSAYVLMIDSGTNNSENALRAYLKNIGVNSIDYLILTHPHEDHIGGADMLIDAFNVQNVLITDAGNERDSYDGIVKCAQEIGNTRVLKANSGDFFELGETKVNVLYAGDAETEDINNASIVVRVDYGDVSFMLTGDAEIPVEEMLLEQFNDGLLNCDLLKVGHHGSNTSTSNEFLDAVSPSYAVISCGVGNSYGHPNSETLDRLRKRNIPVYRTDRDGNIVFVCDGSSLIVK